MAIKQYQAFREPSPYDRERQKAEQLRRYAELLQQQALAPEDEPYTFQGIRAMPSPAAALGKMLQAYGAKKASEKADEAEARRTGMEQEAAGQIAGRLMGGRTPGTLADLQEVTPAGKIAPASLDDLTEVQIGSQYTRSPEDAMRVAMTPQGLGAVRGNPILAAALQQSMEAPKAEKFGTTPVKGKGGKYYLASESGRLVPTDVEVPEEEMTPYQKKQIEIEEERLRFQKSKAGQAEGRGKAPSGYRYDENGELEPIPGGPQDPNRPMTMPLAARNNIITEQDNSRQFAIASQRTNKFIKDIQDGKLPLYKGAGAIYAAERMFSGDETYDEENRPAYDRYYELERFVTEQVNMILSRAKGPQTDQDALRARQQILDNLDNKQVVTTALKTLDRLWNDEINLSESTIDDWYSQYNQPRKGKSDEIIDLPSRRRGRPGGGR